MWKTILASVLSGIELATIGGVFFVNSAISELKESNVNIRRDIERIDRTLGGLPQNVAQLAAIVQTLQRDADRQQVLLDRQDDQIKRLGNLPTDVGQLKDGVAQIREELRAGFARLDKRIDDLRAAGGKPGPATQ